jgi:DNA-binding NtrC family response regulator
MSGENAGTYRSFEEGSGSRKPSATSLYLLLAAQADEPLAGRERLIPVPREAILLGRGERDAVVRLGGQAEVRVRDNRMSGQHARLRPSGEGLALEDLGSTNGTKLNGEKVSQGLLTPGAILEVGHTLFTCARASDEEDISDLAEGGTLGPTRSIEPKVLAQISRARRVAPSQVSVLIAGESGTGKEILAREIHHRSGRSGRLVAVNCAAIPEALLESELFGYKKGAFTGALASSDGLVAAADGGTLFLDEIGEMSLSAQTRLLRVLQEREVVPLGETRPRKVDIRLVAATNRDLRALALSGRFRGDLYARLEGVNLELPPLAQRRGDLGILLAHFLKKFTGEQAARCAPTLAALRLLFAYAWPFNIRELEKVLEAAVALSGGERPIEPRDLPPSLREERPAPRPARAQAAPRDERPLSEEEEELKTRLSAALRANRGNVSAVAREWGKARMQIQRWMKRLDLRGDGWGEP